MMGYRCSVVGILLFALVSNSGALAKEKSEMEVHGHRGTRGLLPENTLPAFKSALEAGADVLEMDIAITKDGAIVVSHDPFINPDICLAPGGRKIEKPPLIHSLTLAQIKKYDCGTLKNQSFDRQTPVPGTPIPTLDEVFSLVRNSQHPNAKRIKFNIEAKVFPDHPEYTLEPKEFVRKSVARFKASGFWKRIIFQSFDDRVIAEARQQVPSLVTSFLIEDPKLDMVSSGKRLGVVTISPDFNLLNKNLVASLHHHGLRVVPWTVNKEEDWKSMIEIGVDGIITDYPAQLLAFLKLRQ